MSVWQRISDLTGIVAARTGDLANAVGAALDPDSWLPGGRDAAFTLALVALSAKMAVADGVVTNSEVRAFRSIVDIPKGSETQVSRLFELAQQDVAGYRSYARKVARLFASSPETLEQVLDGLFRIAAADGMVHEYELRYLRDVSDIFGFDEVKFEQIAAAHVRLRDGPDPYLILGISPGTPPDEIRRVYLRLVAEHHPDRLAAKGVPEEMMVLANARMAAINHAYDMLSKTAG